MSNLLVIIGFICLCFAYWYLTNSLEKERDAKTDYSQLLGLGKISQRNNGDIWLGFKYTKNETNKFNHIRETYEMGQKVRTTYNNDIYFVSHTINPRFIDKNDKDFNDGTYYIVKLVPEIEYRMVEKENGNKDFDRTLKSDGKNKHDKAIEINIINSLIPRL